MRLYKSILLSILLLAGSLSYSQRNNIIAVGNNAIAVGNSLVSAPPQIYGDGGAFWQLGVKMPTHAWGAIKIFEDAPLAMKSAKNTDEGQTRDFGWSNEVGVPFVNAITGFTEQIFLDDMTPCDMWDVGTGPLPDCANDWCGETPACSNGIETMYDHAQFADMTEATHGDRLKMPKSRHIDGQMGYSQMNASSSDNISTPANFLDPVAEIEMWCVQRPNNTVNKTAIGCDNTTNAWRCRGDKWQIKNNANSDLTKANLDDIQLLHFYWKAGTEMQFNRYSATNGVEEETDITSIAGGTLSGKMRLGVHGANSWPIRDGDDGWCTAPIVLIGDSWSAADRIKIKNWFLQRFGININYIFFLVIGFGTRKEYKMAA